MQPRRASASLATLSLNLRLLFASLVILPLFLGITAVFLDRSFYERLLTDQAERMRLQQLLLARAANWDGQDWYFEGLDEIRFRLADSGLYAFILSPAGEPLWRSPSALLRAEDEVDSERWLSTLLREQRSLPALGETRFSDCRYGGPHFCHFKGLAWGSAGPETVFLIVESQASVIAARQAYRGSLLWLLLATAALLVLAQLAVLAWGLLPMRRIAGEIKRLESGDAERLEGSYPKELQALAGNLNALIGSEQRRRERVRNTMDRLAHVLRSPLMLIRNSDQRGDDFRDLVDEQVSRMLGVVEGELAKARLDGRAVQILGKPIAARPVLERIVAAYGRLPRLSQGSAPVEIDASRVSADAVFYGEERDLQDLFGSILENSLKYCRQRIEVAALMGSDEHHAWFELSVGDDGDGLPPGLEQEILQRGARADSANIGHGIGLAIVVEIVSAYQGSLQAGRSRMGGALFTVRMPAR